jgi:Zn-dependent M28 family amino/carboxypeptidase
VGHRLLLAVLVATASLSAQEGRAPAIESIQERALRADLFFLAGDGMQGRLTGTPGNALAADWIRSRFERLGLRPGGQGQSFEHRYQLMTAALADGNAVSVGALGSGVRTDLGLLRDFYPHRFSASAEAEGQVVFAGFGIVSPERKHDDYKDAVQGRVALVLDREPGVTDADSVFDGLVTAEAAQPLRKVLAAQAKGAIGVIFVEDAHNQAGPASNFAAQAAGYWPAAPPRVERYTLMAWANQVRIPVVQVSADVGELLVARSRQTLAGLARTAEARGGVTPMPLTQPVRIKTSVARHTVPDRSIVAMIDGADAALAGEAVLVSAHYDHEGADGPRIFNGADDDGSGIVGLLAIAEAYAQAAAQGRRPKRSVIFAAWNSEERGLLGAWAYTEDPVVPLDRIVANLNMDMIGRNEEVEVGGGARFRGLDVQTPESNANATNIIGSVRAPGLRAALDAANQGLGLELKYRYDNNLSNLMRRSDHWPFIQRGVPGVWVHTGLHPDYHTTADRPEKINYGKMETIVRLVYQTSWDLATAASRPALLPVTAAGPASRQ